MLQCHLPWDLFDDHNGACGECLALLKAIEVHHHVHVVVRAGVELQGERRVRGVSVLLDLRCCAVRHACTCLGVGGLPRSSVTGQTIGNNVADPFQDGLGRDVLEEVWVAVIQMLLWSGDW